MPAKKKPIHDPRPRRKVKSQAVKSKRPSRAAIITKGRAERKAEKPSAPQKPQAIPALANAIERFHDNLIQRAWLHRTEFAKCPVEPCPEMRALVRHGFAKLTAEAPTAAAVP